MIPHIRETILVEGKYDKITLSQCVDASIIELGGFRIFKAKETLALLRRLAAHTGLIVLTDSDAAGFLIRNHLRGALPKEGVKHAYIPDIPGRERRKSAPSREGKLGVEGMSPQTLLLALQRAGATIDDGEGERARLTKADLYELGLSGGSGSAARRQALLRRLQLPERLSSNALLEVLNALYTPEELRLHILNADRDEDAEQQHA